MSQIMSIPNTSSWGLFNCNNIYAYRCNVIVTAVAIASLYAARSFYLKLQASALPFDKWSDTLKWTQQTPLTDTEFNDLKSLFDSHSPVELARRCYARQRLQKDWYTTEDLKKIHSILPVYQENKPRSVEDESAAKIQGTVMMMQPIFAFIRDISLPWREVLQPIQSSPRFAYTILFNCLAPYVFNWLWEGIGELLPSSIARLGQSILSHRGKIALAGLGMMSWLYYKMDNEQGNITHITQNFANTDTTIRGIDLLPSYQKCLREDLLPIIGSYDRNRPKPKSNILWYYNKNTHSTFGSNAIGDILGELTATRRILDDPKITAKFPSLKNLQIVKINLNSFLLAHRTTDDVIRGWKQIEGKLQKQGNTLVVITGFDKVVMPHLLRRKYASPKPVDSQLDFADTSQAVPADKTLAKLFISSLETSSFQCLIEVTEEAKWELESNGDMFPYFTPVKSPDLTIEEIETLCIRLFCNKQLTCRFNVEEIRKLFSHLKPVLDHFPHAPSEILEVLERALGERANTIRVQIKDPSLTESPKPIDYKQFEKAERNLSEALQIKNRILRQLWKVRDNLSEESREETLKVALLMMEKIVIPAYVQALHETNNSTPTDARLVSVMQKRFKRLYGKCTDEEFVELGKIEGRLKEKFKGQDIAIRYICKKVIDRRRLPPFDGKPLVLFFAGNSGLGKSNLSSRLAYELDIAFGIHETSSSSFESNVIRIYLNRKTQGGQEGWDVIRNDIIRKWARDPTKVVIFEEWDKMEESERSSLLDLIDESELKYEEPDGTEKKVDKSCATVIFTSNIEIGNLPEEYTANIKQGIRNCFKKVPADAEAFLNRIDAAIPFVNLTEKTREELINMELDRLINYGIIEIEEKERQQVVKLLLQKATNVDSVRVLKRFVQKILSNDSNKDSASFSKMTRITLTPQLLENVASAHPSPVAHRRKKDPPSPTFSVTPKKKLDYIPSEGDMASLEDSDNRDREARSQKTE